MEYFTSKSLFQNILLADTIDQSNNSNHSNTLWEGDQRDFAASEVSDPEPSDHSASSKQLTSSPAKPRLEVVLCKAHPTSGGVTASTEMLAAKRHAGVHTPVIACKMIIANQQMAYAA